MSQNKRRVTPKNTVALLFLVATLLLLILAGLLARGRAYHLNITVDLERLSPTISGAEVRTELDLVEDMEALSMDEDVSLLDLYREDSSLSSRLIRVRELSDTVQEILYYLGSYDARFGTDTGLIDGTRNLLQAVERAKLLLAVYALLIGAAFLGFVFALLFGKRTAACILGGLAALALGSLPLGVLAAAGAGAGSLGAVLSAAAHYGVGILAGLKLTALGKAQILFASAALFTTAGAFFALSSPGRPSARPTRT